MLPAMILAMDYLYYAFAVKLNRIKNAQCGRLQEIAAGRTDEIRQASDPETFALEREEVFDDPH